MLSKDVFIFLAGVLIRFLCSIENKLFHDIRLFYLIPVEASEFPLKYVDAFPKQYSNLYFEMLYR